MGSSTDKVPDKWLHTCACHNDMDLDRLSTKWWWEMAANMSPSTSRKRSRLEAERPSRLPACTAPHTSLWRRAASNNREAQRSCLRLPFFLYPSMVSFVVCPHNEPDVFKLRSQKNTKKTKSYLMTTVWHLSFSLAYCSFHTHFLISCVIPFPTVSPDASCSQIRRAFTLCFHDLPGTRWLSWRGWSHTDLGHNDPWTLASLSN